MGIPGNTGKNAFGISEYVLTNQNHVSTEKLGWEYLGILKKISLGYQNISLLNKNTSKMKDYGGNTKQMSLWYQNMYLLI